MAKSPSPWSVKGVDPEAREAAKIAARKAGMTVGTWLSQIIRQSATEQLRGGGQRQPQQAPPERPAAPGGFQNAQPPAPTIQAVFESIQRLSQRIEQSEKRTAETIAPIAEKVSELSTKIEEAKTGSGTSTAPVERAVQKIAERLDKIEDSGVTRGPRPVGQVHEPERRGLFGLFRRD
jgi:localization factor PodJL